ncbi:oxidoreductase [Bradyrhizobium lablabi]|uniref:PDR/VanB family oxidoreductase n=1 Tax=Bradyrhizobium lablabi TaxID=722472 RepID=UPI001BA471FE|nr:PDR/VanB family oxidoreductase [Bradyrhizobium lablabi]MBR1124832.1 oxidoreductase [Bradyrhizobium lablabi]
MPLEVRVDAIRYLAEDTHAYEFVSRSGIALPTASPGDHVDVHLPNGLVRQYSLWELRPDRYVIAVKRDPASRGGSRFLHEEIRVGTRLLVGEPRNHFSFDLGATHSVFVAGGIGITPIMTMVDHAAANGMSWELHYATRSNHTGFTEALARHGDRVRFWGSRTASQPLDIAALIGSSDPAAHFYCCGPESMIAAFREAAQAIPEERVRFERFGAMPVESNHNGFTVVLARSGRAVPVPPGTTILDALLAEGLDLPFSCQQGVCGQCETKVLAGAPDHHDQILTDDERASGETMMICCSGSKEGRLVLDL